MVVVAFARLPVQSRTLPNCNIHAAAATVVDGDDDDDRDEHDDDDEPGDPDCGVYLDRVPLCICSRRQAWPR